jgi:hypothetical protein
MKRRNLVKLKATMSENVLGLRRVVRSAGMVIMVHLNLKEELLANIGSGHIQVLPHRTDAAASCVWVE